MGSFWGQFGIVLGSCLDHFGIILGSVWDRFGIILGSFWDHFGISLGSFWDHFGNNLGSFWGLFGIILGSFWDHFGAIWKMPRERNSEFDIFYLAGALITSPSEKKTAKCKRLVVVSGKRPKGWPPYGRAGIARWQDFPV